MFGDHYGFVPEITAAMKDTGATGGCSVALLLVSNRSDEDKSNQIFRTSLQ
jgi:hypothetical protein